MAGFLLALFLMYSATAASVGGFGNIGLGHELLCFYIGEFIN